MADDQEPLRQGSALVVRRTFWELEGEVPAHLKLGRRTRSFSDPCLKFGLDLGWENGPDPGLRYGVLGYGHGARKTSMTSREHCAVSEPEIDAAPAASVSSASEAGGQCEDKQRKHVAPPPGIFSFSPEGKAEVEPERTTVVFKNLPPHFSKESLMKILDDAGLHNKYNFVYLPIDFRSIRVLGYAMVNFIESAIASDAFERLKGATADGQEIGIQWSLSQQGYDVLVKRYRDSPVMHSNVPPKFKPIILADGSPVPFPPPTIPLKAPRRCALIPD